MKSALKAICVLVAAVGTFFSGFQWHLSASAQVEALSIPAGSGAEAIQKFLVASAHHNLWAAWGAMAAGVAVFFLLFFNNKEDAG